MCVLSDQLSSGESCARLGACAPGLTCVSLTGELDDYACQPYCDPDGRLPELACDQLCEGEVSLFYFEEDGPTYGVCLPVASEP